mgnify:CR=1 FL=1
MMKDVKAERQKVQEITQNLEQGIRNLFESQNYKMYLRTMSKFHSYSINNTILIAMQKPDATLVAGYKTWQNNFERHVKKGEKGIRILAPTSYKVKKTQEKVDPKTGEIMLDKNGTPITEEMEMKIPSFRVVSVFDVSQTDGKDLPSIGVNELAGNVEKYEDIMQILTQISPVPISYEQIPGPQKGFFDAMNERIVIRNEMSQIQTIKTAIHEIAHAKLHSKEQNLDKNRNTKEVEAESVAYTVCQHFDIDTSDYSFGYIATWSTEQDMKELKSSLDTIRKAASELIVDIEDKLADITLERAFENNKECIFLIQNDELTRYSLLSVEGMDKQKIVDTLSVMNESNKLNIPAYLESKGARIIEIATEKTRESREYHLDIRYNMDTDMLVDLKEQKAIKVQLQKNGSLASRLETKKRKVADNSDSKTVGLEKDKVAQEKTQRNNR